MCVWLCGCVQHDPVAELLMTHYPSESRKTLPSVESVPMDTVGLQRLVVSKQLLCDCMLCISIAWR